MNPIEVKLVGVEYVAYYFGKQISKARSLEKVLKKLHSFVKSQG